jgi:hypothetical protein
MATTSFVVLKAGEGWTVFQDGEPLTQRGTKAAAVDLAHELAAKAGGLGGAPSLYVQDNAGELQRFDLNAGVKMLTRLLDSRRASPAQA